MLVQFAFFFNQNFHFVLGSKIHYEIVDGSWKLFSGTGLRTNEKFKLEKSILKKAGKKAYDDFSKSFKEVMDVCRNELMQSKVANSPFDTIGGRKEIPKQFFFQKFV